ncbi:MAG: c-type cytochrome [Gemmatimonadota bacterium]
MRGRGVPGRGPAAKGMSGRPSASPWLALLFVGLGAPGGCGGDEAAEGDGRVVFANLPAASQELPAGVTAELIARGDSLFHGIGFCYTCHGAAGAGIPQLGGDLTDAEWRNTDGSYQGLLDLIAAGVSAESSPSGVPMPPRGGGRLTDEQVRAVAAYVWVLSRRGR